MLRRTRLSQRGTYETLYSLSHPLFPTLLFRATYDIVYRWCVNIVIRIIMYVDNILTYYPQQQPPPPPFLPFKLYLLHACRRISFTASSPTTSKFRLLSRAVRYCCPSYVFFRTLLLAILVLVTYQNSIMTNS